MDKRIKRIISLTGIAVGSLIISVSALFMSIGIIDEILNPTYEIDGMFMFLVFQFIGLCICFLSMWNFDKNIVVR